MHNLMRLSELSGLYSQLDDKQKDFYDFLDLLNIEARYPNEKEQLLKLLTLEVCTQLLSQTEEELEWLQGKL